MVMERFHGTIRSKKHPQKKNTHTHPDRVFFLKKMTQTSTFHIQQWLVYQMISEMTWQKKPLTIGGKKPPKVNDNKLAFRITDGKPHTVVTLCSYRKDVSQICVHIPVSMKILYQVVISFHISEFHQAAWFFHLV